MIFIILLIAVAIAVAIIIMATTTLTTATIKPNASCAIVIPLHPKHFHFGRMISKTKPDDVDIYFVFTTRSDADLIKCPNIRYLILTDFTDDVALIENFKSIVSIKKLYALKHLYKQYDYICCIDSEISFLKTTGYYDMMANVAKNKKVYGGLVADDGERKIVYNSLMKITPQKDHEKLNTISRNFLIYTWWSNVPVYDCKNVANYFEWINFDVREFNWFIFDDLLYNYFCILFCNYELVVVPNLQHSLELAPSEKIEYVNNEIGKLYWVNGRAFAKNKKYYLENDFYIVFHLDR